jgi:hypothetical protein
MKKGGGIFNIQHRISNNEVKDAGRRGSWERKTAKNVFTLWKLSANISRYWSALIEMVREASFIAPTSAHPAEATAQFR